MIEQQLANHSKAFKKIKIPASVLAEAKTRVLDAVGCMFGAFMLKPARVLRSVMTPGITGPSWVWGLNKKIPARMAAWLNGSCVRALDYNDTYLSKEPCHPSDLIPTFWAAAELAGSGGQGRKLLEAVVLGYDVMCRLCDAASIRKRGWDHVTYLPIASAVGCSHILGLTPEQTRHAIALSVVGNNALRQTRVGSISDWKASCAAYAASAGLWSTQLAKGGFTGPHDIFGGRNGFFKLVSGSFKLSKRALNKPWRIFDTHIKYFPAEHHSQSAIEAAAQIHPYIRVADIKKVEVDCFQVAVEIIGSEKEKWIPQTRETADHSMPYLVAIALMEGVVTLEQYEKKRYLKPNVRALLKKIVVKNNPRYSKLYPKKMPTRVSVYTKQGRKFSCEVLLPKGYAGRPMTQNEVEGKFRMLSAQYHSRPRQNRLIKTIGKLEKTKKLMDISRLMIIK